MILRVIYGQTHGLQTLSDSVFNLDTIASLKLYKPELGLPVAPLVMCEESWKTLSRCKLPFSSDSGFQSDASLWSTSAGILAASEPTVNTNRQTKMEFILRIPWCQRGFISYSEAAIVSRDRDPGEKRQLQASPLCVLVLNLVVDWFCTLVPDLSA